MYRHTAESILESNNKRFITLDEKVKYNNYERTLRLKSDSYDRTEVANLVDDAINVQEIQYESTYISDFSSTQSVIRSIELHGNTIQDRTNLKDIKSVGVPYGDKYRVTLCSSNRNLFNIDELIYTYRNSQDFPVEKVDDDTFIMRKKSFREGTIKFMEGRFKPNTVYRFTYDYIKPQDKDIVFFDIVYTDGTIDSVYPGYKRYVSDTGKTISYLQMNKGTSDCETTYKNYQIIEDVQNCDLPYVRNKTSEVVLDLPCQLEQVHGIADRLYKRQEDGVWCIEKYIKTKILTHTDIRSINWFDRENTVGCLCYYEDHMARPNNSHNVICDSLEPRQYNTLYGEDSEGISMYFDHNYGAIVRISRSKLISGNHENIVSYIRSKPMVIKYALEEPQTIELSEDIQIALNSYDEVTYVFVKESGVHPTIKCTIANNTGATMRSVLNEQKLLSERIDRLEKVKSDVVEYNDTNTASVTLNNTTKGYSENILIKGNTIVNYASISTFGFSPENSNIHLDIHHRAIGNGIFKMINNTGRGLILSIYRYIVPGSGETTFSRLMYAYDAKEFVFALGADEYVQFVIGSRGYGWDIETDADKELLSSVIIVPVDQDMRYTYDRYKNIASVGDDVDTMSLIASSRNVNLFDKNKILKGKWIHIDGSIREKDDLTWSLSDHIDCSMYKELTLTGLSINPNTNTNNILFFNHKKEVIEFINVKATSDIIVPEYAKYIQFSFFTEDVDNIRLFGNKYVNTTLQENRKFEKELLYKDSHGKYVPVPSLRGVNDEVYDSIEKHSNGKYYYHKRCEQIKITSGSNIELYNVYDKTTSIRVPVDNLSTKDRNLNILSNRYKAGDAVAHNDVECISSHGTQKIYVRLAKGPLDGNYSLANIKNYIKMHPIEVVYELETPEVYECADLDMLFDIGDNNLELVCGLVKPREIKVCQPNDFVSSIVTLKDEVSKNTKFRDSLYNAKTIRHKSEIGQINIDDAEPQIINDVKIYGNSMVNILENKLVTFQASPLNDGYYEKDETEDVSKVTIYEDTIPGWAYFDAGNINMRKILPNTTYTLVFRRFYKGMRVVFCTGRATNRISSIAYVNDEGKCLINTLDNIEENISEGIIVYCGGVYKKAGVYEVGQVAMYEGDHMDKPLNYSRGITYSGDTEPLTIQVRENVNILGGAETFRSGLTHNTTSEHFTNDIYITSAEFVNVEPKTTYKVIYDTKYPIVDVIEYDSNQKRIKYTHCSNYVNGTITTTSETCYIKINVRSEMSDEVLKLPQCIEKMKLSIVKHNGVDERKTVNKKEILFLDKDGEYKPVKLRSVKGVSDTIERHDDGNYYLHKRVAYTELTGNEYISYSSMNTEGAEYVAFVVYPQDGGNGEPPYISGNDYITSDVICNRFKAISSLETLTNIWTEGVTVKGTGYCELRFAIKATKLISLDAAGFSHWLKNNKTEVLYPIHREEIYPVNNLDLHLTGKSSTIIVSGGACLPTVELNTSSNMIEFVKTTDTRLKELSKSIYEEDLYESKLMLNSMFTTDIVNFRVDTELYSVISERDTDEDLIKLILTIIESGEENYDISRMEYIIDFYTVIGKIDFEVAIELLDMLYKDTEEDVVEC